MRFDLKGRMDSCFQSEVTGSALTLHKPRSLNPNPLFGSHASCHIVFNHHGEEADGGDLDVEESYHSCNGVALE